MKLYGLIATSLVTATLLVGCGSSGGGDGDSITSIAPTEITTEKDAKNAIAAISGTNSFSSGLTNTRSVTRNIEREVYSQPCYVSGSMTIEASASDYTKLDSTTKFDNCDNGGGAVNGNIVTTGSVDGYTTNMTMSMNNYSQKSEEMYLTADIKFDIFANANTGESKTIMNGTMHIEEYVTNDVIDVAYDNFSVKQEAYNAGTEINGKTAITSKNYSCINGTYDIKTIQPLQIGYNGYTDGEMEINGALYHYNNDGSVDVTLANGDKTTISQTDEPVCN